MNNNEIHSTLEYLNLQDCIIDGGQWSAKTLILHFESIDVLGEHPKNTYDIAKCAEDAQLIFTNCKVSNVQRIDDDANPIEMSFQDLITDFEIFDVTYQRDFDKKMIYKITGQCSFEHDSDFGEFTLTFDSVDIEWESLEDDSWFVDFED